MLTGILCLLFGILGGVISGLTVIGGGMVVLPALAWIFHLEHQPVLASSLVATSVSTLAILAFSSKIAQGHSLKKILSRREQGLVIACGLVGILIPHFASLLNEHHLQQSYMIVLLTGISLQLARSLGVGHKREPPFWTVIPFACLCVLVGGTLGIGGSILFLPILQILGFDSQTSVDLSSTVTLVGLMTGALSFIFFAPIGITQGCWINGQIMTLLLVGGIPAAVAARHLSRALPPEYHQRALLLALVVVALFSLITRTA